MRRINLLYPNGTVEEWTAESYDWRYGWFIMNNAQLAQGNPNERTQCIGVPANTVNAVYVIK